MWNVKRQSAEKDKYLSLVGDKNYQNTIEGLKQGGKSRFDFSAKLPYRLLLKISTFLTSTWNKEFKTKFWNKGFSILP